MHERPNPLERAPALQDTYLFLMTVMHDELVRRAEIYCRDTLHIHGGPRAMWVLLAASTGTLSQGDIAEILGINRNVMVKLVDRLEKDRMLRRAVNVDNRRQKMLRVTGKGQVAVDRWRQTFHDAAAEVFAPATPEGLRAMREMCIRFLEHMHRK